MPGRRGEIMGGQLGWLWPIAGGSQACSHSIDNDLFQPGDQGLAVRPWKAGARGQQRYRAVADEPENLRYDASVEMAERS